MKARGKKLLAAMLSLAMVLSMFVVPASAAPEGGDNVTYPEWTFINDGNAQGTDYTTLSLEGLTIAGDVTKHGDQYGLTANGATFTATVPGPCTVTVTVGASWLVWMEEDEVHKDRQSCYDNSTDSNTELVFNYTGEAGTVKIQTSSDTKSSYILSIKTSAPAGGEDVTYPEWTFINDGNAESTDYTTLSIEGLTIAGDVTKHGDQYGVKANGATFTATVPGPCTVTVTVGASWLVWMEEDAVHKDRQSCYDNSTDSNTELVFNYTGEAGTVKIHTSSDTKSSYILSIKTSAPAGGGEDPEPSTTTVEKGVYQLSSKGHAGAQGSQVTSAEGLPTGITFDSTFAYDNPHGPHSGAGKMTVNIPDGKYSTLTVTICQFGAKGGTITTSSGSGSSGAVTGSTDDGLVYTIVNATGETVIAFSGEVYVHGITVGEFTDQPSGPSLTLGETAVTVEKGDTVEVTAEVDGDTPTSIEAASNADAVATASYDSSKRAVIIEGKSEGTATVTVTATLSDNSTLEETIAVTVEVPLTGDIGDKWEFTGTKAYSGKTSYKGLAFSKAFNWKSDRYGVYIPSGTITIPVKEPCDIEVVANYSWDLTLGDKNEKGSKDLPQGQGTTMVFPYTGEAGTVDLVANGQTYIISIEIKERSTDPDLTLDKGRVELKLGETEIDTVIATKANTTAAVKIVSNSDDTVATAELGGDGKTITITAKKAGTTTVTVGLDGVAGQDKDIAVLVKPAGAEVVAPGTHIFGNKSGEGDITAVGDDGHKAITGIEWGNFVKHDNDHGLRGSGSIIVHLPEDKYSTITVITCHHGNGNPVTATGGSDISVSDEAHTEPDGGNGKVYTISNAKGDTTITFGGSGTVYLHALTIGAFTDEPVVPPPTLTLDKDKVTLEMGVTTSAAVTATVENFEGAVKAASRNPAVATAAVNGNTITITAKAVGETYVDVTLDGVAELKRSVRVYVDPEGGYPDIMAEGTIYFDQLRNADYANVDFDRIPGFDAPNFAVGNEHGIAGTGDITIKMAKSGSITVQGCTYGAGKDLEMTTSSGTVEKKLVSANNGEANTPLFFVTGAGAGDVTLTFSGGTAYIHYIMVEYDFEITDRKYDVWDFSGKAESGENYNNHITAAADYDGHVTGGLFTSNGNLSFGDLTINHQLNDRLYSTEAGLSSIANTSGDYTGWYCNGAGNKDITRCITIAHVAAGDKIVAYIGGHNGNVTYHFQGVGPASAQDDVKTQSSALTPCVFVAEHTGTYKIWSEGGNKPLYQRIERYRGVKVSGSLTLPAGFDATGYAVKFINQDTEQVTFATLDGTDFSVTLAPGFTYVAALSGAPGWGITADSRFVTTTNDEVLTGKADVALEVGAKALYTYSGTISGFADGYDVSNLAITMVPDKAAVANGAEKVELTLAGMDFTAKLDPDNVTYTLEMTGVNDYAIKAPAQVSSTGADLTGQTITVEAKALQSVSGKFRGLTGDAAVTALSFENVDDGYTYDATVTANGYTANLRAGAYAAVATVAGHTTKTHVVVTEGEDTVKDLLFVSTASKPAVTWAKDVYVGYADREDSYKTLREAVDAVSRMNVTSEAKRVTIHIAPGTYREQVIIETPYITLMNDTPEEEVLVTWYYGIGYKYYSSNGKYDAELAYDKFAKGIAGNWGATVQVTSAATAFRAEGITFENSFNRYVTKEEIADGVEPAGNEKIDLERTLGMDVSTNAATERGTAMYVAAGQSEFYNCKFYSSQDTLYTNGKIYFKNCFIEGQTDYIFGDASSKCVFDACTLNWKGYSANSKGGYITALRTNEGEVGYLFRSCVVSGNPELTVTPGYFGRPWGAKAGVFFLNTKLEKANLINPVGWYEMSGNQPENAQYKEFGTTAMDGAAVDTSKRISGTVATQAQADAVKVSDYFGGWKPYYYKDEDPVVAFTTDPTITADAELDKLYPGNVLTVNYSLGENNDANDDSVIQWYRVKGENEYLLATTTATVSKSYKLSDSTGGCQIKVVVTPTTISGNKGEAKSFTLEQAVNSRPSSDMVPTGPSGGSGKGETVTNSDGSKTTTKTDRHGNVTVTTKAPDGSQVVAYTSKDGDKSITVTDAKGTVQAKVELPAVIPAPEEKFADVPEGHWAEESINRMAGLGTIQGIGGGNYDMNSPITRGSVATILYRLSNVEVDGSKGAFTDVESGDWYAEAVAWASSTGVVTGYSESIFAPKDSIDRQQLAVMLYRYAKLLRLDTTTEANLKQFQDAADVADWAADAMSWCVGEGILKGNGYGSLNPAGTASRAECATMLDRFIGLL